MTEDTSKGKRRGWRVVLRIFLALLALVVITAGVHAVWGWSLSRRHAALVDELHGMGVPAWEDVVRRSVPEEENGAPLLLEVDRIYWKVQSEIRHEMGEDEAFVFGGISVEEWTDEQRECWLRALPRLEPCFALIERAAGRSVIMPEVGTSPWGGMLLTNHWTTSALLWCRFLGDPESGARSVPLLLKLAASDRAWHSIHRLLRFEFRSRALKMLRAGVETGAFDVTRIAGMLRQSLDDWEPVAEWRRQRRGNAMTDVWLIDEYRAGRDPVRDLIETLRQLRANQSEDDEIRLSRIPHLASNLSELEEAPFPLGSFQHPRWLLTSWIGRPFLLRKAVSYLEAVRDDLERDPAPDATGGEVADRQCLVDLARKRLARLAVEIVACRAETGKLPTARADLPLPAEAQIDPFTGEPIRFESDGASVTISTSVPPWVEVGDGPDEPRATLHGKLLLWTVR